MAFDKATDTLANQFGCSWDYTREKIGMTFVLVASLVAAVIGGYMALTIGANDVANAIGPLSAPAPVEGEPDLRPAEQSQQPPTAATPSPASPSWPPCSPPAT